MGKVINFFDKMEDKVRAALSRHPIVYALIGGTSIVLFWRGIWMVADTIPWLTGPASIVISIGTMLLTGLFVSFFIGDTIIISGLKKGKRVDEKIVSELKTEFEILVDVQNQLNMIEKEIKSIKDALKQPKLKPQATIPKQEILK